MKTKKKTLSFDEGLKTADNFRNFYAAVYSIDSSKFNMKAVKKSWIKAIKELPE
jgi:hypothetical protein